MPTPMAKRLNCTSTSRPDQRLHHQEHHRRLHAHLARRDRPRARALDPCIDVAVDQIVPGAAGAAHDDGADQQQHDVPGIGPPGAVGDGGERRRPPARQQQQPPADRAVETRQPEIGTRPSRRARCRPSFRSHRRRVRPAGSSLQRVARQRVEGAAAGQLGRLSSAMIGPPSASLSVGARRSRRERRCIRCCGCGSCWRGWSYLGDDVRRHAAELLIGFEERHHLAFLGGEGLEQRADLLARRLARRRRP